MSFVKLVSNIGEFCFETNLPSENVNLKKTDFLPALIGYAGASSSCAFPALHGALKPNFIKSQSPDLKIVPSAQPSTPMDLRASGSHFDGFFPAVRTVSTLLVGLFHSANLKSEMRNQIKEFHEDMSNRRKTEPYGPPTSRDLTFSKILRRLMLHGKQRNLGAVSPSNLS